MFFGKKRRIVGMLLAVCLSFTAEFQVFAADPQSETQTLETINYELDMSSVALAWEQIPAMASVAVDTQQWQGKALANTDGAVDIYDDTKTVVIAKMYHNTVVTIEEEGKEWCTITSGSITGCVRKEMLLFGSAAVERAAVVCAAGTQEARTIEEIAAQQREADIKLLAALIYCEAGNQPYEGKVAVGSVVMNRMNSGRFPNSLQGVIYQRGQFTPAMTGKLARVLNSGRIPAACYDAAFDAMSGAKPLGNVLFFNTSRGAVKLGDHYFT